MNNRLSKLASVTLLGAAGLAGCHNKNEQAQPKAVYALVEKFSSGKLVYAGVSDLSDYEIDFHDGVVSLKDKCRAGAKVDIGNDYITIKTETPPTCAELRQQVLSGTPSP